MCVVFEFEQTIGDDWKHHGNLQESNNCVVFEFEQTIVNNMGTSRKVTIVFVFEFERTTEGTSWKKTQLFVCLCLNLNGRLKAAGKQHVSQCSRGVSGRPQLCLDWKKTQLSVFEFERTTEGASWKKTQLFVCD